MKKLPNNTDPAREAKIAESWKVYEKQIIEEEWNSIHIIQMAHERGFRDGAASIDRVQVVREAFDEVRGRVGRYADRDSIYAAMDAVLETIGEEE